MILTEDGGQPKRHQEDEDRHLEPGTRKAGAPQQRDDTDQQRTTADDVQDQLEPAVPQGAVPADVTEHNQAGHDGEQLE